ncbi:MAG TPA: beta-ribofuranosylaminobenzene 5'-phosphate synthase family protein [Pirellulales bacterium]|jgi:beta-RFAP synthase|nr:beta-ribofuranosylaminobenzene 5'-phosphate synthase family protein [Pirellulales bacterium]
MNRVQITAASRLHFGLLSFGRSAGREYGGVGLMLAQPGLRLTVEPGASLAASGPLAERALDYARRAQRNLGLAEPAPYRIVVESAPPDHVGLGTGTQLALAVAAAVCRAQGRPLPVAPALARLVGRGERSAIGTHGFYQGGLLLEAGKLRGSRSPSGAPLSPLLSRVEFPPDWRFVLIRPATGSGLSGAEERQAFAELPPVDEQITQQLCAEALLGLLPAAAEHDFERCAQSLGRYSRLAGSCFAARQGGPYAGTQAARRIHWLAAQRLSGIGQSSWGPTLFALLANQADAERLAAELHQSSDEPLAITIAAAANRGAQIAES